jgi:hypothetical protein
MSSAAGRSAFGRPNWLWDIIVPVAIAAGTTVLWLRFNVAPGAQNAGATRMAVFGDLINYYFPMSEYLAQRLKAGSLPLWNPYACSGIPLLATAQVGAFYPGSWLRLVLPASQALPVRMFVECTLSGWFCTLLFRAWGCDRVSSVAGGILFVFSSALGLTFWPPALSTILWMPWLLLCVEKLVQGLRFRWWAGLALGTALQIFAGFPQYFVYSSQLVALVAILRLCEQWRADRMSGRETAMRGIGLAAATACGIGLASVQLLPTLELVRESARHAGLTPAEVHYLNRLAPHRTADFLRAALSPSPTAIEFHQGTAGGYVGIPTLILAAVGVVASAHRPLVSLLVATGVATLLLSDGYLGWTATAYAAYAHLPVVGTFRTPERLRLLTLFCEVALAAMGFCRLGQEGWPAPRQRRLMLALLLTSTTLAACMLAIGSAASIWRVAVACALALLLVRFSNRVGPRLALRHAILAFLLLDLFTATGTFGSLRQFPVQMASRYHGSFGQPALDPGFLQEELRAAGLSRVELPGFFLPRVATGPSRGAYRISCYEPLVPRQWAALNRAISATTPTGSALFNADPERYPTLYDVTSVTRVLRPSTKGRARVSVNADALPRAYLIDRFRVTSREDAIGHVVAGDIDFRTLVLLDRDPGLPQLQQPSDLPVQFTAADITEYFPERVVVHTHAPTTAFLVLTDTDYPGWRARIDGKKADIFTANGLYRAVRINAGTHHVVFDYQPASLRSGAAISLLSLLLLAALGFVWRIQGARPTTCSQRSSSGFKCLAF